MKKIAYLAIPLLAAGLLLLVTACAPKISQEEYNAVVGQRDAAQTKLASTQSERDATQKELASLKADLNQLIVLTDSVRGHIPSDWGPTCALNSQYHRGEMIVWRTRVIDPETGNQIPRNASDLLAKKPTEEELKKMLEGTTVTVHLSDGQSFPMHFAGHSGQSPNDYFWTYGWEIPKDYPTGSVGVWVTAEANGKAGRWDPFKVAISLLTILE